MEYQDMENTWGMEFVTSCSPGWLGGVFSIKDAAAMVVMLVEFVRHSGQDLPKDIALCQGWDMAQPIRRRQFLRF